MNGTTFLAIGFLLATAVPRASEARVVRLAVERPQPFVGGIAWGTTGPYEKLLGTTYMDVGSSRSAQRGDRRP